MPNIYIFGVVGKVYFSYNFLFSSAERTKIKISPPRERRGKYRIILRVTMRSEETKQSGMKILPYRLDCFADKSARNDE